MPYTSNAEWTNIGKSQDTHETKDQARGVCLRLLDEHSREVGLPCKVRGWCLRTWVEKIETGEGNDKII